MNSKIKIKKLIGTTLAVSMLCSSVSWDGVRSYAAETGAEASYVVMTTKQAVSDQIAEKYEGEQLDENEKFIEVDLTKSEASALDQQSGVVVEKDYTLEGSIVTTGDAVSLEDSFPRLESQLSNPWNKDAIHVEDGEGQSQVKVELLDSGVSGALDIDLYENIDFVHEDEEFNPMFTDDNGHGTALAGVMCAKNDDTGIVGINPDMKLCSVKALDSNNESPLSRIIRGIYWGIENDVDIINMSFGTTKDSKILHKAIKDAKKHGILLIAAAGNTKHKEVQYPAAYEEVIAVGSLGMDGDLAEVTSCGTELELLAPGENIITNGFYQIPTVVEGTSIATAQVTGVASLLYNKTKDKKIESDLIRGLLRASGKGITLPKGDEVALVDYENAKNMYSQYADNYQPGIPQDDEEQYEATDECQDYTEEAQEQIYGLWEKDGHENMVPGSHKDASSHQLEIIRTASSLPDEPSIEESATKELHGTANYVGHLKYLWYLSVFMGRENTNNTNAGVTEAIIDARKKAKEKLANTDVVKNRAYIDLTASSGELIRIGLDNKPVGDSGSKTARRCQLIVLGYICHLIGDTYSHRTVIPANTPVNNSSTDVADQFMKTDFSDITTFKSKYSTGRMDYRYMKNYCKASIRYNKKYIDNPEFYSNRYKNANECVKFMLNSALAGDGSFSVSSILPSKYPSNSKLHYLKSFAEKAGVSTSKILSSYTEERDDVK